MQKFAKLSIIQPGIARFRSNLEEIWSHEAWCTSNFQDQRVKSQGHSV